MFYNEILPTKENHEDPNQEGRRIHQGVRQEPQGRTVHGHRNHRRAGHVRSSRQVVQRLPEGPRPLQRVLQAVQVK